MTETQAQTEAQPAPATADTSTPMIVVEGLVKNYGATHAVKGISFSVPKGEVLGFLGPNGAGKSTTMKIITGFIDKTAGTVKVGGIETSAHAVETRRMIGYLPENNPLYEDMMVAEYLEYIAAMRELPKAAVAKAIAHSVERCGLGRVLGKDIGELSKGFRQRVGLAQAILHDPALLILDEPTSGLDPNQVVEIRSLIKDLGREKTVIMSTHVLPEVQATCGRAVIIADGRIVADGSPQTLTASGNVVDVAFAAKRGAAELAATLALVKAIPGVGEVAEAQVSEAQTIGLIVTAKADHKDDLRRQLFETAVANDLIIVGLSRRSASLEETFRKLTTRDAATPPS